MCLQEAAVAAAQEQMADVLSEIEKGAAAVGDAANRGAVPALNHIALWVQGQLRSNKPDFGSESCPVVSGPSAAQAAGGLGAQRRGEAAAVPSR